MEVIELFAGVGGFRLGLTRANQHLGANYFDVVWSNQWEPSTKAQHASDVYVRAFGEAGHSNQDISTVASTDIPRADLLVGGFPCQDYSVATALQRSHGLMGKKGVLWWEIHRLLRDSSAKPRYLLLENVDRLLKSPATQRGRDFAVMLASLSDLGYAVEWRVINAADYGMPQRRRRVFILGYLRGTPAFDQLSNTAGQEPWMRDSGVLARAFPVGPPKIEQESTTYLDGTLADLTESFNHTSAKGIFLNSGIMVNRLVHSRSLGVNYSGQRFTLRSVLEPEVSVPEQYFISDNLSTWIHLKGPKKIPMISRATGEKYVYSEGGIAFPDNIDRPSRTIVTGEGGASPSRFKHVVLTDSGRYRRLMPVELERLNMFPEGHTSGLSDARRAFLMGNALVVGVVERLGISLAEHHSQDAESSTSHSPHYQRLAAD